ncbi:glycosyltransferase family 8 protein [Dyadobacter subterraneus]|uniref:Glycosyltransferase family 8 protein n=1 Tax=Dyadobacter subterraneus TaxID=2773304 RepID=A0ABR9WG60_9BACT|nr:glycosyltransferase family 8 protein [Dyadobacter subterraneus]MBE9463129.1 glycosyltransferase family 8 protein [Dyadobacter subterraneus]
MNRENTINIVMASDNHYAILLGALIKSIEVNHKTSEKINLYVIDDGISKDNQEKIRASASPEIVSIFWFKTSNVIPENIKIPVDKSAFPITTYLRLFAPYILPAGTERYIYLDVDMIVLSDISDLWKTDLNNNLIAAVQDLSETAGSPWGGIPNYKELGIAPEAKYFNAGMMIVDVVQWLKEDITNKVIQCLHDNLESVNFADQYGLNVILVNRWQALDPRWNSFSILDTKDPFLIHYLDIKPIFRSYKSIPRYQDEFYKYLRLTPWKNHKPIPDYVRMSRKAINKVRKIMSAYLK